MNQMRKLLADRTGTAAVEMGLILGLIVIAMFGALVGLGSETTNSFSTTADKVQAATS
ncbi:MAG: Flp family type IVb pilin [Novosphingobium sp.]|jgi:Flp pilus assembly pilin Flp|nr:Flp family type IVb pilin [Novosphingobium sp.]